MRENIMRMNIYVISMLLCGTICAVPITPQNTHSNHNSTTTSFWGNITEKAQSMRSETVETAKSVQKVALVAGVGFCAYKYPEKTLYGGLFGGLGLYALRETSPFSWIYKAICGYITWLFPDMDSKKVDQLENKINKQSQTIQNMQQNINNQSRQQQEIKEQQDNIAQEQKEQRTTLATVVKNQENIDKKLDQHSQTIENIHQDTQDLKNNAATKQDVREVQATNQNILDAVNSLTKVFNNSILGRIGGYFVSA